MARIVGEELDHIAERPGDLPQQLLRTGYNSRRLECLSKEPAKSAWDVLHEVLAVVQEERYDFDYDETWFRERRT